MVQVLVVLAQLYHQFEAMLVATRCHQLQPVHVAGLVATSTGLSLW